VRVQRTWLRGARSQRDALVLQFAPGMGPFPEVLISGTCIEASLAFWPGAFPLRAKVGPRDRPTPAQGPLPGRPAIRDFLTDVAGSLAKQPWIDRWPCTLNGVIPVPGAPWTVVDSRGDALPLAPRATPWMALALSGGGPLDLTGEWNGDWFTPLAASAKGTFHILGSSGHA
jgi:hypothetical protein